MYAGNCGLVGCLHETGGFDILEYVFEYVFECFGTPAPPIWAFTFDTSTSKSNVVFQDVV